MQPERGGVIRCSDWLDRHLYHEQDGIRIFCGDNREILPMLGEYDLMLTDPPYGISVTKMTLGNAHQKPKSTGDWDSAPAAAETLALARSKARLQIVWGGNYLNLPATGAWLVWDKNNGASDFADGELAWTNLGTPLRILKVHWCGSAPKWEETKGKVHPTQKPLGLMRLCLDKADDAKTILDPWMGSGTTLIAARDKGLKADGIEINEQYCEAAKQRLSQGVLLAV